MARKRKSNKDGEVKDNKSKAQPSSGGSQLYMYVNSDIALKDSANLAFSDVLGLTEEMGTVLPTDTNPCTSYTVNSSGSDVIPGIMCLEWAPGLGTCEKSADTPANVAALNSYSFVRHANSGHGNYDHTDLMMVIIAVANVFAWLGSLMRLYGVMSVFNQKNRYMARTLVRALGFDYDDLVAHINDLRAFLNHKISEASVLWIPNTMHFVSRWFMMNSYIYQDAPTPKAQLYVFRQRYVYEFQNKTSSTGSKLKCDLLPAIMTYSDIVSFTSDLMRPLISDEDVGIMCGDILKAFGSDKIYGLSQIPDEYVNMPVYDEEMLMQIHNCTILGANGPDDIEQDLGSDPGFIYQKWAGGNVTFDLAGLGMRRYFDLKGYENDPAIVMVASRLSGIYKVGKGTNATGIRLEPTYFGTEYVTKAQIYLKPSTSTQDFTVPMLTCVPNTWNRLAEALAALSKFDWAPLMYINSGGLASDALTLNVLHVAGEIENYTTVGAPELAKLHRTAVYGELGIPYI